jgi:hypothetical protein
VSITLSRAGLRLVSQARQRSYTLVLTGHSAGRALPVTRIAVKLPAPLR